MALPTSAREGRRAHLLDDAASGEGLREHAHSSTERALLARLELAGLQRGARALHMQERLPLDGGPAFWFQQRAMHLGTAFHEGVGRRPAAADAILWAQTVLEATGVGILQLACANADADAEQVTSGRLQIARSAHGLVLRRAERLREVLTFPDTFEQWLTSLGRHSRRNMRHAIKQAAAEQISFGWLEGSRPEFEPILTALARTSVPYSIPARRIKMFERYARLTGRPFRSVLRAGNGQVISYCCGFQGDPDIAYLTYQLNDQRWKKAGLSLMHRAFLIEALIEGGCRELVFVHGCSGILRHACLPMPIDRFWLMRRGATPWLNAAAIAALKPDTDTGRTARVALAALFHVSTKSAHTPDDTEL